MARDNSASSKPNSLVQSYLVAYNLVSFLGWGWILYSTVSELILTGGQYEGVASIVWKPLTWVQTAAVFEVIHAALGLVRAPLSTTFMQVLSRLFLVWGVNAVFPEIHTHWSFSTMMVAWSIAECVRYSYYVFNLTSSVPAILIWARYTMFLVLYPMGVGSELTMVYQSLPYAKEFNPMYYYGLIIISLVYLPGFPILLSHMFAQRRKYLRGTAKKTQ